MQGHDWQADWERCERATPGRWSVRSGRTAIYLDLGGRRIVEAPYVSMAEDRADFEFMAAAREGWPVALEERARLEKRVEELTGLLRELCDACHDFAETSLCNADPRMSYVEYQAGWAEIEEVRRIRRQALRAIGEVSSEDG